MKENGIWFLDLETTGLDPERRLILQIGWGRFDATTGVLFDHQQVEVWHPQLWDHETSFWRTEFFDPIAFKMHEESGLLRQVRSFGWNAGEVEQLACKAIPEGAVLAGYSVHFDREFLRHQMPFLFRKLHHRLIDVSTIRSMAKFWRPELVPEQAPKHWALADCGAACSEFVTYARALFGYNPEGYDLPPIRIPAED